MKTLIVAAIRCSLIFLVPSVTYAISTQWDLDPISGDWNTPVNWTPNGVPNGPADIATFGLSNTTDVSISADTEVNSIVFTSGATNPYTITANPNLTLTISGKGIINNSGVVQNFRAPGETVANSGTPGIKFINAASAGTLVHFTTEGSDTANFEGGRIFFYDTSSAENARFTNQGGSTGAGITIFFDSSTATNGAFTNNGGSGFGAFGGRTIFTDNATAAYATFINNPGLLSSPCCDNGGFTLFSGSATAANSVLINNGGIVSNGDGGSTSFFDNASAASATITNNSGTVNGAHGGLTFFGGNSTAGNAFITNQGGAVSGAAGGITSFSGFNGTASAGSATIINNGAAVNGALGGTTTFEGFFRNSHFFGNSTAGNATIINNGANISGAAGGETIFNTEVVTGREVGRATAANATLVANGGTNGGEGGGIFFKGLSTGGTSRIEVFGNGFLDISEHDGSDGVSVGSIEGNGNVFLGTNNLTVGSNNLNTTFSGVVQDGGQRGAVGGSLTKIGTGTFVLAGANTYTGDTNVNRGVLQVDGSITSNTFVNRRSTLAGAGTINGNVVNNGTASPGSAGSPGMLTVTGNYTQAQYAALMIQLAGANAGEFSVLNILGTANLSGQLNPTLLNGFVPAVGESFTFLQYGAVNGTLFIHNRNIDDLPEHWEVSYFPTFAILSVAAGNVPVPDQASTLLLLMLSLSALLMCRRHLVCKQT